MIYFIFILHILYICIWLTLLSKTTYIAFNFFNIFFFLIKAFPGNRTHDFGGARDILYCLRKKEKN